MIFGLGIDHIETKRFKKVLSSRTFFLKLFTEYEETLFLKAKISNQQRKLEYWAVRFAAKEAFSKALGTGIGKTLSYTDLEIVKNSKQKPYFQTSKKLNQHLKKLGISKIHLSLSHTKEIAIALVLLEKN
jgi:holo-[acyl-carrier protein] synthase